MNTKTNSSATTERQSCQVLVIGAGASGIAAAIAAARAGSRVTLLERLPVCAKKVLASGGGKCNLLNRECGEQFYNAAARTLVREVFRRHSCQSLLGFFRGLGLQTYADAERIFPRSNQASSVVRVLEIELRRLGVVVEYGCPVTDVHPQAKAVRVTCAGNRSFSAERVIIACGGASYPALGSNGSGFELCRSLGHGIVPPVPSCVPLVVKDRLCHFLQGQKMAVEVKASHENRVLAQAQGELLFTQYGLSGTAVLDVSREVSVLLNRQKEKNVHLLADFVPWMSESSLAEELGRRQRAGLPAGDLLAGILSNRFSAAWAQVEGPLAAVECARRLKNRSFAVSATRGWNEAEFTAGGVDTQQVDARTLCSRLHPAVYLCGEVLDVDGVRGGHNLAWAWASGLTAGENAARMVLCPTA